MRAWACKCVESGEKTVQRTRVCVGVSDCTLVVGLKHRLGHLERKWLFGPSPAKIMVLAVGLVSLSVCCLMPLVSPAADAQVWLSGFAVELALVKSSGVRSGA
jgi:hypothetical protein